MADYIEKHHHLNKFIFGRDRLLQESSISAIGNNVAENRHALINRNCGMGKLDDVPIPLQRHIAGWRNQDQQWKFTGKAAGAWTGCYTYFLTGITCFAGSFAGKPVNSCWNCSLWYWRSSVPIPLVCASPMKCHDSKRNRQFRIYLFLRLRGSINRFLQSRFHFSGPINTINTACSSSANAIMYEARLIKAEG